MIAVLLSSILSFRFSSFSFFLFFLLLDVLPILLLQEEKRKSVTHVQSFFPHRRCPSSYSCFLSGCKSNFSQITFPRSLSMTCILKSSINKSLTRECNDPFLYTSCFPFHSRESKKNVCSTSVRTDSIIFPQTIF